MGKPDADSLGKMILPAASSSEASLFQSLRSGTTAQAGCAGQREPLEELCWRRCREISEKGTQWPRV